MTFSTIGYKQFEIPIKWMAVAMTTNILKVDTEP
jgi:hypothetical protein